MSALFIYISENLDGVLAVADVDGRPGRTRVIIGGGGFLSLTLLQLESLASLCVIAGKVPPGIDEVVYYDGVHWAHTDEKRELLRFPIERFMQEYIGKPPRGREKVFEGVYPRLTEELMSTRRAPA